MKVLQEFFEIIERYIWGYPLLFIIFGVGFYLTWILKGIQFRYFFYSLKLAFSRDDGKGDGDVSNFQALMIALAAMIGIGSITGVATGIAIGGMGSLFWMWIAAFFGMSTKYAEGVLGVVYRKIDKKKEMCGGPMYYLEHGAKSKFLSISFAILCSLAAFTSGGFVQANSIAIGLQSVFSIDPLFTGIFLAVITGLTLFKGIKSIGKICGILVPAMGIFYILGGLFVIAVKYVEIPRVISLIFSSAFTGQAATGGFVGSTILIAMQFGVSRAIFSSEAGLGTSPIASASAKTNSPVKQALISMSGVFITSFVICTITGLVIGVTNSLGKLSEDGTMINGSVMAIKAFEQVIPGGGFFVAISIFLFGFSTILGWAYYGEKALEYLFDLRIVRYYRVGFTLLLIPGSFLSVGLVWSAMNIMNALMSIPNLIGLLLLAKVVSKYTKEFDTMVSLEKQSSLKKVSKA